MTRAERSTQNPHCRPTKTPLRLLLGGDYLHRPSSQRVTVIDHEYSAAAVSAHPAQGGRSGRLLVRPAADSLAAMFLARVEDLEDQDALP